MSQLMYYDTTSNQWLPIVVGAQGLNGTQGTGGLQGTVGLQGTIGLQGTTGIQGSTGLQGTTGSQGIIGSQGLQGTQGLQGFGFAQSQGTTGTQGIQGPQGTTGIQGVQGIQGRLGLQGQLGFTGAQGIQGIQGLQGIQGNLGSGLLVGINARTTTTYTLVSTDVNKLVTLDNTTTPITLTVPPSVFSANDQVHIQQLNIGQVTVAAGSGVTITSTGVTPAAPNLRVRYSSASIICTASNTFTVLGDIT